MTGQQHLFSGSEADLRLALRIQGYRLERKAGGYMIIDARHPARFDDPETVQRFGFRMHVVAGAGHSLDLIGAAQEFDKLIVEDEPERSLPAN